MGYLALMLTGISGVVFVLITALYFTPIKHKTPGLRPGHGPDISCSRFETQIRLLNNYYKNSVAFCLNFIKQNLLPHGRCRWLLLTTEQFAQPKLSFL